MSCNEATASPRNLIRGLIDQHGVDDGVPLGQKRGCALYDRLECLPVGSVHRSDCPTGSPQRLSRLSEDRKGVATRLQTDDGSQDEFQIARGNGDLADGVHDLVRHSDRLILVRHPTHA